MTKEKFLIKGIITYVLFMCVFISFIVYVVNIGVNSYTNTKKDMGSHIRDTVIISKDTSIVIDYDSWNDTYTLSNGVEVAKEIVENEN